MKYSRIMGTGGYTPEKIITNADLEKVLDTTDEWITQRVGIKERHILADDETNTDMAEKAARQALAMAGIDAQKIDLIVVGTSTPDYFFPSTACLLQHQLGIKNIPAFDVSAACAGFVYALSIADQFIKTGAIKTALVIGSDALSRIVDWQDRRTCILFSDGAGAVVLQASDKPGVMSTHIQADGSYKDLLYAPNHITLGDEPCVINMKGSEVFKIAVRTLRDLVTDTLAANHLTQKDIDWLIPHQANLRIILSTAEKLELPMERVVLTIDKHGNSSAASIPLALDVAVRDGRVQRGQLLLCEAFGGGFTWGSALIRF